MECNSVDSLSTGLNSPRSNETQASGDNESEIGFLAHLSLQNDGEQWSLGSAMHPTSCSPCAYFCFKRRGCSNGQGCNYCHMNHVSKQRERRNEWKSQQRQRRLKASSSCAPEGIADSESAAGSFGEPDVVAPVMPLVRNSFGIWHQPALLPDEPCFIFPVSLACLYQGGDTVTISL